MAERMIPGVSITTQEIQDRIHAFADIGADELMLWPAIPELDQMDRLAELIG